MAKLTLGVRVAAASILILSFLHVFFLAALALSLQPGADVPSAVLPLRPALLIVSVAGLPGILIAIGLFRAKNWARIGALVVAVLVLLFCALGILVTVLLASGFFGLGLGIEIPTTNGSYFLGLALFYLFILSLALWWIFLFARKSVAAQFSGAQTVEASSGPKRPSCPPPIALLGWLMIVSSVLSALSWPLILGKIPAMLFTHIFSSTASEGIWAANVFLFLLCGVGLLRLQRWSYTATIALHGFWLVSLFVSQLSASYPQYLGACLAALQAEETTIYFIHFKSSPWVAAITTAIPTALLIAGLFYYRRSFLKAADDSRHLSS